MKNRIQDIEIFIPDDVITDVKFFVSSTNIAERIYFTIDNLLDDSNVKKEFILLSNGSSTLKSLQVQAIKRANELRKSG